MRTIIWDWNGTLLDDVDISLEAANILLRRFNKPCLPSAADYRRAFTFPIRTYYTRIGLGGELFETAAPQWMAEYLRLEPSCSLREGARAVLTRLREEGCRQVILSASKRETLLDQLARFDLLPCFDEVLGLDHIYATSKEGIGRAWMERTQTAPDECVLLGDTTHDAEVAAALGVRCILVCGGHQHRQTLCETGCAVAENLAEAAARIEK